MAKRKKTKGKKRSTRTTKDGNYTAVNVYIHNEVLSVLDGQADVEDRSRRAQLERVLCDAFGLDHRALAGKS